MSKAIRQPYSVGERDRESFRGREYPKGCAWCGQQRRTLYAYGRPWPQRIAQAQPVFCNRDCARAYA